MITFTELLKRAKREHIAIHTPTEKQAITLLVELDKRGYAWCGGEEITTTYYEYYKENTCYDFDLNKQVFYCSLEFYQKLGFTSIEFDDIDLEN